jgi:predicted phosphodiesterase
MRFLCVSDIHGDADALAAVIEEADARETWDVLIACGDLVFPGPKPLETWKLLVEKHALCVQGASDRAIATLDPDNLHPIDEREKGRVDQLKRTHRELGELIVARLARLPPTARLHMEGGGELVAMHGSPADVFESMSQEMSDEELNALIGDDPGDVFVCGGSHVPFERRLDDDTVLVVNVGSVGDAPGGKHADATFLETSPTGGVIVKPFTVDLDR